MNKHIEYKSNLSKQKLAELSKKSKVSINNWIHRYVKNCGINTNKLINFWKNIDAYLSYLHQNRHARETPQREKLLSLVINNIFSSKKLGETGEVIRGNEDLSITDKSGYTRVIFEYKSLDRTAETNEMMSVNDFNRESLAEIIEYYLAERCGCYVTNKNNHKNYINNNKHYHNTKSITGIVTNGYEWFVIPNNSLQRYFNGKLMEDYKKWCDNTHLQSEDNRTDYFRRIYISPFIDHALLHGLKIGYFNLLEVAKGTKYTREHKGSFTKAQKLFYQFLSPQELLQEDLKLAPTKLNKKFYNELLYIIGLEKRPNNKGMQRIGSSLPKNRADIKRSQLKATLIEQIYNFNNSIPFDDAVDIAMSFIDRMLFLKLLEHQLIQDNKETDNDLHFMSYGTNHIKSFKDIYNLFFEVMNHKTDDRQPYSLQAKYKDIPYLNSSLFKATPNEKKYHIDPDRLDENLELPLYHNSVLYNYGLNSKVDKLPVLEYLLDFLSRYNFDASSHSIYTGRGHTDKSEDVINAAILGMVFEKINGYKQGSYFTPDYIAAHMAKKAINASLASKFTKRGIIVTNPNNLVSDIRISIHTNINNNNGTKLHYHNIIKSVLDNFKVIDPAVGSAHFLVAILNYLLKLRFDLNVLTSDVSTESNLFINYNLDYDKNGRLWLTNRFGRLFEYHRYVKKSANIQKAFFNAKCFIIENNLYGVDINPSSVGIAKLRLWIELLKDSYFDENGNMVTMPNLETNIKTGNSLISNLVNNHSVYSHYKFLPISAFKEMNVSLTKLKETITDYRNTDNHNIENLDENKIKDAINRMSLYTDLRYLQQHNGQMSLSLTKSNNPKKILTDDILTSLAYSVQNLKTNKLSDTSIKVDNVLINDIRNKIIKVTGYTTFEWAFEFPELLEIHQKHVNFKGFDLVIMNPPYIYDAFDKVETKFFDNNYHFSNYQDDTFELFIELGLHLTKHGYISMIIPNSFLLTSQCKSIRNYLLENTGNISILSSKDNIFPEASIENCIILFQKHSPNIVTAYKLQDGKFSFVNTIKPKYLVNEDSINIDTLTDWKNISNILDTMMNNSKPIEEQNTNRKGSRNWIDNYGDVHDGAELYEGGKGHPKQPIDKKDKNGNKLTFDFTNFKKSNPFVKKLSKPNKKFQYKFLGKGSLKRYGFNWDNTYIEYGQNLSYPRNPNVFKGERILINRILNHNSLYVLKSAYVKDTYICSQGIETIHPRHIRPLAMLAVLNSKVLGFYVSAKLGVLQKRGFPQIRLYQIRSFRIPNLSKKEQDTLSKYSKVMMDPKQKSKHMIINTKIDNIVMNAFKLNNQQQQYIRNYSLN